PLVDRPQLRAADVAYGAVERVADDERGGDDGGAEHGPGHDQGRFAPTARDVSERQPAKHRAAHHVVDGHGHEGDRHHDEAVHRPALTSAGCWGRSAASDTMRPSSMRRSRSPVAPMSASWVTTTRV